MNGFGANAYRSTGIVTGVEAASPHQLVLMLFDGAREAIVQAKSHLAAGRTADKGVAIGKAVRIIDEGLKASVDRRAGGALAGQLVSLYEYVTMRLLQANLRNDASGLDESLRLLDDLRGAWAQIGQPGRSAGAAAPAQPASAPARPAAIDAAAGAPARSFAATA